MVIDIIAFTDRDDEFENLVLNCIKNRDTKEKEIFDLILKDSITGESLYTALKNSLKFKKTQLYLHQAYKRRKGQLLRVLLP